MWWVQLYYQIIFQIIKFQSKDPKEKTALSSFDIRFMKVVQATHHQRDIRYGMLRGIQCSCMSLMSIYWTLLKFASIWDSFDLDCILEKRDLLFKPSIIKVILRWKTYNRSFLVTILQ